MKECLCTNAAAVATAPLLPHELLPWRTKNPIMAPWPEKVNTHSRRPSELTDRTAPNPSGHARPRPRPSQQARSPIPDPMREFEVLDNANIKADSSSSDEGIHPRRPTRPQHSRSLSQPFPSLFTSGRKKNNYPGPGPAGGYGNNADSEGESSMPKPKKQSMPGHRPAASKDFVTGTCMACGSLVRWPRELQLFRCTICLTINDLEPHDVDPKKDTNPQQQPRTGRIRSGSLSMCL